MMLYEQRRGDELVAVSSNRRDLDIERGDTIVRREWKSVADHRADEVRRLDESYRQATMAMGAEPEVAP